MPKPKRARETLNPIGQKLNEVMAEKGIEGDYAAVAKHFSVAVPSIYGWIDYGRINKSRLNALALWSGKSVSWWLGAAEDEHTESTPPSREIIGGSWQARRLRGFAGYRFTHSSLESR